MHQREGAGDSLYRILNAHALCELERLPPMSRRATEALQLAGKKNLSIGDMVDHLSTEPPLSARLLAVANSARYRSMKPATALRPAVIRVGIKGCRELLLEYACSRIMTARGGPYALMLGSIFERSVDAALVTHRIAPHFGVNPDAAYRAALMQDIGYAHCVKALADHMATPPTIEEMVAAIEPVHGIVGALLVEAWQLPEELADVCLHHHRLAGGKLARLVFLANRLIAACEGNRTEEDALTGHLLGLGFSYEQIDELLVEAADDLEWAA